MKVKIMIGLAVCAALAIGWTFDSARAGEAGWTKLFNGKDLSGWKTLFREGDPGDPKTCITVRDGEIQVAGSPWGFFYTDKSFKNYVIRYSWTYPKNQPDKTTMNSGLLIHIQDPIDKVWPKCIEPQGRYKDHGKLFLPGWPKGSKIEQMFDEAKQQKALKASDEWNTTEVTAHGDGRIEVKINGQLINTGKGELTSGPIGFQSEGARIHFKDIMVKNIK
jgi:hypothetical protein